MAVFNSAVLTTRGNELLVDAVAGDRITFTRMVVGCGEYSDRERERSVLERMTSLKDIKQEFTFSAYKKVSEQCVLLTAVISNRELDYSYKITEIGIYGKRTGDEADFLCSIAVTKSLEESDTFPPYNGLQECQIVQDYYITISPDAEVSVNTQGACVLREEFELIKQTLSTEISSLKEDKLDKDGDGSNLTVTFNQAKDRKNISSGSKLSVIMGIISKVIADLKAGAFSVVVNHLMATEEGGVLDSRQGKVLKDMIDGLKRSLDSLTQSFLDGCKMIVDRLTALGYGPASPQGPEQIVAAINIMYDDRYNVGRIQGRNDVIADPGAYGIDQIKNIYQHEISTQHFEDVEHGETVFDYWESFSYNDTVEYRMELKPDKFLYAVTFDLEYYAIRGYESPCMVAYAYSVKTVEGTVIQSGSIDGTTTGSTSNFGTVTHNILVDLLQNPFETEAGYLILIIEYSMSGQVTSAHEQVCQAKISFTNIQARYK